MKKSAYIITSMILPVIVILAMIHLGCEEVPDMEGLDAYFKSHPYLIDPRDNPDTADLLVSPSEAEVTTVNEQVAFTVTGGEGPFNWDVADPNTGSVQQQANERDAVYTAFSLGRNNVIVSDGRGHVGIAYINSEPGGLEISPDDIVLSSNGDTVWLTVTGGTTPYTWTIVYPALGSWATAPAGRQAEYRRDAAGENVILVADYHARTAELIIEQPGVLQIIPQGSVSVNQGASYSFGVTGGEAPYFWSVGDTSLGTIDQAGLYTGNTVTNTGSHNVIVYDNAGHSDSATVNQN